MKWTKEKLIEIIKEEMGSIEDLTGDWVINLKKLE
jgi:hypothetical protein